VEQIRHDTKRKRCESSIGRVTSPVSAKPQAESDALCLDCIRDLVGIVIIIGKASELSGST
jgi:hypothetical protein